MVAQTLEGRDYEVGAIRNAIEAAATHSASISIVGTAGIGKSTLIDVAIGTAHGAGFRVLESRPAASEVRLSFVGLTDLLLPLEDARALLPRAQREALRVAFGEEVRGDGFPVSTRLVAAATLGALEHAGQEKPIMLVVDDLQWLDEQSYEAVRFAVRRCNGRLVAVSAMRLASSDDVPDRALESRSARQLDLLALAESEILAIVRATSDQPMALGIARRIAELAGGNPFYAVELAHAVEQIGRMPDSLPTTLQQVVSARISGLSQPAREAVQIASAMPDPRVEDLLRINPAKPLALGIAEAESAKVVELRHGSVRFEHPLLARGAYESIAPADRRLLHSALASIARNVEERARHLAHSVTHADPGVLDEIDAAAATARRAGRSGVAAELEDAAISLGDRDPARLLRSATDHFHADGYARALRLLDDALEQTEEPDIRSKALGLIGAIRFRMGDLVGAATALTSAVGLASDDCRARGSLLVELACVLLNSGRLKEAVSAADSAREDAEAANDDGLTAEALGCHALVHLLHGDTLRTADIDRARNLEDTRLDSHALRWPAVNAAAIWLVTGDVRRARPALASARLRCLERGNEADLWFLDYHSVGPALQVGDLASARSHAKEVASQAEASGSEALKAMGLVALARVDLWAGNISLAETRSRKALTAFARISATVPQSMAAAVLCPALLLLGRSSEAADLSREISAILGAAGYQHPGFSISPGITSTRSLRFVRRTRRESAPTLLPGRPDWRPEYGCQAFR